jgi:hypothetical protein
MAGNKTLNVQGVEIHLISKDDEDYISLTDMVQGFDGGTGLIEAWLRNKNTLEFLAVWERINNVSFNSPEFEGIRLEAGLNRFSMSAKKWMEKVNGIGVIAKTGRYGGTFAHKDIAFEFGSWLSPEFKLYLIKEFQRLKDAEAQNNQLEWNIRRTLVKAHYRIHTDAIKANLIPPAISKTQEGLVYATEADLLNKALFGMTAKEWRAQNPDKTDGNIRDYATIEQLVVMASLESQNALLIQQGHDSLTRLTVLNQLAISQLNSLLGSVAVRKLENTPLLDD